MESVKRVFLLIINEPLTDFQWKCSRFTGIKVYRFCRKKIANVQNISVSIVNRDPVFEIRRKFPLSGITYFEINLSVLIRKKLFSEKFREISTY